MEGGIDGGNGMYAYENDQILLFPGRRDPCWNMGAKDMFVKGFNADPNWMTNKGAQNKAIKAMIDRLKEPKESGVDLTNMPNAFDIATYVGQDNIGDFSFSFTDRLGQLLS